MTPPLQRSTVPSASPLAGERPKLTPEVEEVGGGQPSGPPQEPTGQTPVVTDSGSTGVPKWQELERKEARLRADQIHDLAALRRHVAAQRADRSEIITDNTLIRIAVDLLMTQAHRLRGDTEEALLRSVLPRRRPGARQAQASQGAPESGSTGVRE